jgi:hypothetical protein
MSAVIFISCITSSGPSWSCWFSPSEKSRPAMPDARPVASLEQLEALMLSTFCPP